MTWYDPISEKIDVPMQKTSFFMFLSIVLSSFLPMQASAVSADTYTDFISGGNIPVLFDLLNYWYRNGSKYINVVFNYFGWCIWFVGSFEESKFFSSFSISDIVISLIKWYRFLSIFFDKMVLILINITQHKAIHLFVLGTCFLLSARSSRNHTTSY